MLHVSTNRLRELLNQRKIYYTEYYGKRTIPKEAIENFVNGLPAITMLEENIAYYRAHDELDAEMEEVAAKLLAEWTIDPSEPVLTRRKVRSTVRARSGGPTAGPKQSNIIRSPSYGM